ncbi:MAG: ABC transporter ATP-binding protein [Pseudomonadota bacterium]
MSKLSSMFRILFHRNGWRLTLLAGIIYLVGLYSLVLPLLLALAIDVLLPQNLEAHLIALVAAAILLAVLRFCLAFVQDYEFLGLRLRSERSLLLRSLTRLLNSAGEGKSKSQDAAISQSLRIWLVNFQYQMTEILFFCAYAVSISLTILALIFWVDAWIGVIVVLFAALHYANFHYHNPRSRKHSTDYIETKTAFMKDISAAVAAKRAINVARMDDAIGAQLHSQAEQAFGAGRNRAFVAASQGFVQSILRGGLYLLLIAFCAPRIMDQEMTIGTLLFVLLLVSFAYEPVYRLNQITTMVNQLLANYEPLRAFLEQSNDQLFEQPRNEVDRAELELASVSCEMDGRKLFDPVNMRLDVGETCLVSGPSGSGKSTLLDVVAGLSDPSSGKVEWAGKPIRHHRHRIFAARQTAHVFHASVVDNVSLFDTAPEEERIRRLLNGVGLMALAEQPGTIISDATLSLGERQRIALARALYQDPELLLLDEPTANLDPATEKQCLEVVAATGKDRITVVVSHSEQAQAIADKTISIRAHDED